MITPKVRDNKIVFGPCRLSYVHLFEKHSFDGNPENGKYQTVILIPKKEKETVKAIQDIVEKVKTESKHLWGNKIPADLQMPLRDGDERDDDDEAFKGCYYMNAKCSTRPGLVDRDRNPITDEEELYSGVWCICSVAFFGFKTGAKGVGCGLNNLMKFKDGERLGGRVSADKDFEDVDLEDDDDL